MSASGVSDANDHRIGYDRLDCRTGAGDGAPLLLLHGLGHDRRAWDPVRERLAAHHDVIAVDLPGHGTSAPLDTYTTDGYVEAIRAFCARLGIDTVHVAGNSLGGTIALELARTGGVLSATAFSPVGLWTINQARYVVTSIRASLALARMSWPVADRLVRSRLLRAVLLAQYFRNAGRVPSDHVLAAIEAYNRSVAITPTLRHTPLHPLRLEPPLRVPTTIGWGTHDRLLLPVQARRAREMLPFARHVWLTGCGHVPMAEDPATVAQLMLETTSAGT